MGMTQVAGYTAQRRQHQAGVKSDQSADCLTQHFERPIRLARISYCTQTAMCLPDETVL